MDDDRRRTAARIPPPRGARGRKALVAALAAAAPFPACRSYEPRPLDPAAHREAWHRRTLEDGSVLGLLVRLEPPGAGTVLDPADGLDAREGELVALAWNPDLRLARLEVGRAAAGAREAGAWADPALSLDALRITEGVPHPWVLTAGLVLSIPLTGRLAAERREAAAEERAARERLLETEWSVLHEVRQAWIAWSAARLREEETARLAGSLGTLVETAARLAEAGELPRSEATLFVLERARRGNALLRLRGEVEAAEQRLRALLGLPPGPPLALVPSFAVPRAGDDEPAGIEERNPTLARLRAEHDVAEAALARAVGAQVPDLGLGPLLGSDAGQSRAGLLGVIPLPLWNANRRAIAEAEAGRELARAAFETGYERLVGRRAAALARALALERQRAELEGVLAPLVDRALEDAVRLLALGEGTGLVVLESLARAHETKLDLVECRSAAALARAEAEYWTGPPAAARPGEPREGPP